MLSRLKKLPGYIGYLIGSFFISIVWIAEKVGYSFKKIKRKGKRSKTNKEQRGSEIDT